MTQPRVTKRGIGFGYSGFGEATATWVKTSTFFGGNLLHQFVADVVSKLGI